jgi:hypothetical protein
MVRFWKICPGDNGKAWQACYENKVIAVGWNELGDCTSMSAEQIKERDKKIHGGQSGKLSQLPTFLHTINKGDIIVAYGNKTIFGLGIDQGDAPFFKYDDLITYQRSSKGTTEVIRLGHRRHVNWVKLFDQLVLPEFVFKQLSTNDTIHEITDGRVTSYIESLMNERDIEENIVEIQPNANLILYGPPGTGKTFMTKKYAINIIEKSVEHVISPIVVIRGITTEEFKETLLAMTKNKRNEDAFKMLNIIHHNPGLIAEEIVKKIHPSKEYQYFNLTLGHFTRELCGLLYKDKSNQELDNYDYWVELILDFKKGDNGKLRIYLKDNIKTALETIERNVEGSR